MHAAREDCQTSAAFCCTERGGIVKQFRLAHPETVIGYTATTTRPLSMLLDVRQLLGNRRVEAAHRRARKAREQYAALHNDGAKSRRRCDALTLTAPYLRLLAQL